MGHGFKTGTENDFSVCTTWGVSENGYYLLHVWRDRVEFPELKRVVASLAEQWKPNAILVEDKASGQSLLQELKLSTALPIITVRVDTDKQTRAQAVTPLLEAGRGVFSGVRVLGKRFHRRDGSLSQRRSWTTALIH